MVMNIYYNVWGGRILRYYHNTEQSHISNRKDRLNIKVQLCAILVALYDLVRKWNAMNPKRNSQKSPKIVGENAGM